MNITKLYNMKYDTGQTVTANILRRKAHILRCNQEAQGACFEAQGAYIKVIKLGGKRHRSEYGQ